MVWKGSFGYGWQEREIAYMQKGFRDMHLNRMLFFPDNNFVFKISLDKKF